MSPDQNKKPLFLHFNAMPASIRNSRFTSSLSDLIFLSTAWPVALSGTANKLLARPAEAAAAESWAGAVGTAKMLPDEDDDDVDDIGSERALTRLDDGTGEQFQACLVK